jgi:hypothetical protein
LEGKYLFQVKALSKVFRARYVSALRKGFPHESKSFFNSLFQTQWVVYAKRPFGGPLQVVEYLSRYTHKIAISNHRLANIGEDSVAFNYKDYRQLGCNKQMTLQAIEFIRRFALHILPKGFVRIRHYGILSSKVKVIALPAIRDQFRNSQGPMRDNNQQVASPTAVEQKCSCCKKGTMKYVMDFDPRGPPLFLLLEELLNNAFTFCNHNNAV